jgi:hypothetical protein
MAMRFVAELPRRQTLCVSSELSSRILRKVLSPTLFPINVARLRRTLWTGPVRRQGLHRDPLGHLFIK